MWKRFFLRLYEFLQLCFTFFRCSLQSTKHGSQSLQGSDKEKAREDAPLVLHAHKHPGNHRRWISWRAVSILPSPIRHWHRDLWLDDVCLGRRNLFLTIDHCAIPQLQTRIKWHLHNHHCSHDKHFGCLPWNSDAPDLVLVCLLGHPADALELHVHHRTLSHVQACRTNWSWKVSILGQPCQHNSQPRGSPCLQLHLPGYGESMASRSHLCWDFMICCWSGSGHLHTCG